MADTLAIGLWLDLITAAFFLYVSWRVAQISSGPGRMARAMRVSQWFWIGTALFMILDGAYGFAATRFDWPSPWHALVLVVRRSLFAAGLAALVHWMWVMQSRHDRHVPYLFAGAVVMVVFLEALSLYQNPLALRAKVWGYEMVVENPTPLWANMIIGIVLFLPVAVLGASSMRLYHSADRYDRFRIVAFAIGAITFPTGVLIGFWDNEWYWYGVLENRVAFSVALGTLFMIRPPLMLRRLWKIPVLEDAEQVPCLTTPRSP